MQLLIVFSGYYQRIYEKFRDIVMCRVNIQKISAFCPVWFDYKENFCLINSWNVIIIDV